MNALTLLSRFHSYDLAKDGGGEKRTAAGAPRKVALFATLALLVSVLASAASATPLPGGQGGPPSQVYNCTGGNVPPGTYNSMVISGVCFMPAGNIVVRGNLDVSAGALLDAVSPGDPTTGPVVPATVVIEGNAFVGNGGVLLFGCSPNISCANPPGISYDSIRGNLIATGAQGVVLHSAAIGGNVLISGGGGGAAAETCNSQQPSDTSPIANLEPWSEDPNFDFTPVYTDAEDDTIGGNLVVSGLTSCWLGGLRNQVGGNLSYTGNTMGDPDAMEIDNNVVNGNMICSSNSPAVQFGDSLSAPNIVGGIGIGECGLNVVVLSPAPEATAQGYPTGIPEHIAVSTRGLRTFQGTFSDTNVASLPPVTTESGDSIIAQLDNFALSGAGLTGSGTYNSSLPPGASGEAFLATLYPDGSTSFTAYMTCVPCSFDGQSGAATVRAYGTVSANGFTTGTFLVTSGGPVLGGPSGPTTTSTGGLGTLAGYGTFFGSGSTVRLVEHLAIAGP
jgi:hypothetical protein